MAIKVAVVGLPSIIEPLEGAGFQLLTRSTDAATVANAVRNFDGKVKFIVRSDGDSRIRPWTGLMAQQGNEVVIARASGDEDLGISGAPTIDLPATMDDITALFGAPPRPGGDTVIDVQPSQEAAGATQEPQQPPSGIVPPSDTFGPTESPTAPEWNDPLSPSQQQPTPPWGPEPARAQPTSSDQDWPQQQQPPARAQESPDWQQPQQPDWTQPQTAPPAPQPSAAEPSAQQPDWQQPQQPQPSAVEPPQQPAWAQPQPSAVEPPQQPAWAQPQPSAVEPPQQPAWQQPQPSAVEPPAQQPAWAQPQPSAVEPPAQQPAWAQPQPSAVEPPQPPAWQQQQPSAAEPPAWAQPQPSGGWVDPTGCTAHDSNAQQCSCTHHTPPPPPVPQPTPPPPPPPVPQPTPPPPPPPAQQPEEHSADLGEMLQSVASGRRDGDRAPVIVSWASKGGTGKTSTALGLAAAAAEHLDSVIVVDMNRGQGDTRKYLRLTLDQTLYTIYDAALKGSPKAAIMSPNAVTGARHHLLPEVKFGMVFAPRSGQSDPSVVTDTFYRAVIDAARDFADLVIVDTQIVEDYDTSDLIDRVAIPLVQSHGGWGLAVSDSSLPGVDNTKTNAEKFGVGSDRMMFIVNKLPPESTLDVEKLQRNIDGAAKIMGTIPLDDEVVNLTNAGRFSNEYEPMGAVLNDILFRILGMEEFATAPKAPKAPKTKKKQAKKKRKGLFPWSR